MKSILLPLTVFGTVAAALQWHQIAYRIRLFHRNYGGEPYTNHIGNGDFALIHVANMVLLLCLGFAVWRARAECVWRWLACSVGAANLIAWASFAYMHQTGVLVEYHEFIRHGRM